MSLKSYKTLRPLCAKRNAEERISLLKLLKDGAIFCSERYPEEAEAIDLEISRQLNAEAIKRTTVMKTNVQNSVKSTTTATTTNDEVKRDIETKETQLINQKTIEQVQKATTQPPKIIIEIAAENKTTTNTNQAENTNTNNNNNIDI